MAEYLSKEKKEELQKELLESKSTKRKTILDALEYAKSLGDLSENAEYHQAREDQGKLEERIQYLETLLEESLVIEKTDSDVVEIGSFVKVKKSDGEEKEFTIVGQEEADFPAGKISHGSPIGEALMGKKKGDEIIVHTPKGDTKYKITKVN